MKKLLALFLALVMVFSLVACGKDDDNDNNGSTSNVNSGKLFTAVISQLTEANSAKITVSGTMTNSRSFWTYGENDDLVEYQSTSTQTLNATVTIVKTDSSVDAKIELSGTSLNKSYDEEEEEEYEFESIVYLIDGAVYTYNEDSDLYIREDVFEADELADMLDYILEATKLNPEEAQNAATRLTEKLINAFNIKDGVGGSLTIDLKKTVNDLVAIINATTVDSKLSDTLNAVLALLGSDLTTAKLIDELEALTDLTVEEAFKKIDKYLADEYSTSIQKIFNDIVGHDDLGTEIAYELDMTLEELRELDIYQLITDNEVNNLVLWDLFALYAFPNGGPTKDAFFTEIRAVADLTVGDLAARFNLSADSIEEILADVKDRFGGIVVNELKANVSLGLAADNKINSIGITVDADFKMSSPSEVEDETKKDCIGFDGSFTVNVTDICKTDAKIALPEDSVVIKTLESETELYYLNNGTPICLGDIEVRYYDSGIYVCIDYLAIGTMTYYNIPYSVVDGNSITLTKDYTYIAVEDITITFNEEKGVWFSDVDITLQ